VLVAGFSSYYSFLLFFFSFFFGVVMLFIITNMSFYSSSFSGKHSVGPNDIFTTLSNIRTTLAGDWPPEKLVHVVEKLQCRAHGQDGVAIRVSGSFIIGNQVLICGDGIQVEGLPNFKDLSIDLSSKRMGTFREQFIMEPSNLIGCYLIAKQELYIIQ
jgi:hypothetical protein